MEIFGRGRYIRNCGSGYYWATRDDESDSEIIVYFFEPNQTVKMIGCEHDVPACEFTFIKPVTFDTRL